MSHACMLLGSSSRHNKNLEWRTLKPLGRSQLLEDRLCYNSQVSNGPCYSSSINQCYSSIYLDNSWWIHLWGVRAHRSKDAKRRSIGPIAQRKEREGRGLWLLFLFVSVPGPVLCKLGQPGVLFVLPGVLTLVLGPSFVLFLRAFPSRSFSHRHFGLFFPILTT